MKVSAVQKTNYYKPFRVLSTQKTPLLLQNANTTFGIANAGKLKLLFTYGVPCMYSGIEMIDPPKVQRLLKSGAFQLPIGQLIKILEPFEHQLADREARVYTIVKEEAEKNPDLSLKQVFETLAPIHRKRLRKKQAPIFQDIIEAGQLLPEEYRYKFDRFMAITETKLDGKPVYVPFSTNEFKYRLEKIREDINKRKDVKGVKVLNKMLKEAERLPLKTSSNTEEHQKTIINFLEIIRKRSVLQGYEPLEKLITTSLDKLNHKKLIEPFSRKSFIYNLGKLLRGLEDEKLRDRILDAAETLPTSKDSTSAYIIKCSADPSEKIAYRLLWPTFASIEHIKPKSKGGADAMSNFGGATTLENSTRCNIDFNVQLKRKPETKTNCQKYIDRIIELARNGVFKKHKIDTDYIRDFKNTVQKESKGALVVNIAEFEKKARF